MPGGIWGKVAAFVSSPKGRELANKAKAYATDPQNQQKAKDALKGVQSKISKPKGGGTTPPAGGTTPPAPPAE